MESEFDIYVKVMDMHGNVLTRTNYVIRSYNLREARSEAKRLARLEYTVRFNGEKLKFRTSLGKHK